MPPETKPYFHLTTGALLALLSACVDGGKPGETLPSPPSDPAIYIETASAVEGNAGESVLIFNASLNQSLDGDVSVRWATRDGSADQTDYIAGSGLLSYPAGTTQRSGEVIILGDTDPESTESFDIILSELINDSSEKVGLAHESAKALIINDDGVYLNTQPLNDTGVIACAVGNSNRPQRCSSDQSFADQDAHFGRDAKAMAAALYKVGGGWAGFDFTKLDSDGDDLSNSQTDWSCVRDNRTGLVWEVKTNDRGLRDRFNTYSWYFPAGDVLTGGDQGAANGGQCHGGIACDTQSYIDAINTMDLCGRGNTWRLPTPEELRSINDYSRGYDTRPTLDVDFFPHDPAVVDSSLYAKGVWSMLSYYPDEDSVILNRALGFSYQHGTPLSAQKSPDSENAADALYVRLVNGG